MSFDEIQSVLQKEWAVISSAPMVFSTAAIMLCVLTWLGARLLYSQQIKTKDATIEYLRTRIGQKEEISRAEIMKQEVAMLKQQRLLDKQQQAAARRKQKD
jgi:hypothetical protein